MEPRERHSAPEYSHQVDDEILNRVLHDLRNPLTLMTARTQLLKRNIEKGRIHHGGEFLPSLAVMEQAARKMDAILKDFQGWASVPQRTQDHDGEGWPNLTTGKDAPDRDNGPLL